MKWSTSETSLQLRLDLVTHSPEGLRADKLEFTDLFLKTKQAARGQRLAKAMAAQEEDWRNWAQW